jgi:hypothetical protein
LPGFTLSKISGRRRPASGISITSPQIEARIAHRHATPPQTAPSRADDWKVYRLADAALEAPAGWTQSSSEREIILTDPAGRELRVEWGSGTSRS